MSLVACSLALCSASRCISSVRASSALIFSAFARPRALDDPLPSFGQHLQDRSIGEAVEQKGHDTEADDLGEEMRGVQAKGIRRGFGGLSQIAADARKHAQLIHKLSEK